MFRRSVSIVFALFLALAVGQGVVLACGEGTTCNVERKCTKTDTGMTCVVKAKGETTVDQVRACVRKHADSHHKMEGVTVEVKDIEGGIEIVMTADSPDALKALQEHGASCCAKHEGGCEKHEAGCDKHAAVHAKDHDCSKDCSKDCPHAKAPADTAAPTAHDCSKDCSKDCPHAKPAADTPPPTAHDCSKDCSKDCTHENA